MLRALKWLAYRSADRGTGIADKLQWCKKSRVQRASNYNSTKLCLADFGFSPGGAPDKNESMSSFLPVAPKQDKPKLLDQVRSILRLKHYSLLTGYDSPASQMNCRSQRLSIWCVAD
jgi:hypothetical protein